MIAADKEASNDPVAIGGIVWNNLVDMRLIHCLIVNEVKEAYLQRHEGMSRRELGDRNSNVSTIYTLEQIMVLYYDNKNFKPITLKLPILHENFINEYDLSLPNVPCGVTADQVTR